MNLNNNKIVYQYKKARDCFFFHTFWIQKHTRQIKPISKIILVIRLDAIGDSIIWLDQAKEYRKAFPDHKIVLLHNKVWSDIAEQLPWFNECIPFDRSKVGNKKYYKELLHTLNKYNYEKVFSPVFSRDFITVDWLIHNINASEKIGYEGDYNNNIICTFNLYYRQNATKLIPKLYSLGNSWHTKLVPNDVQCVMELQRNAHFIRQTINPEFKSALPSIPFNTPLPEYIPKCQYAVFFLGASTLLKTWPINNFHQIEQYLPYETILLCGSSDDRPLAKNYLSFGHGSKTILDLTGKTTLLELISIISKASLVVTNDTSASHIAVATRTPSICLLGGGHYGRFHPYQVEQISDEEKKYLPTVVTSHNKSCFNCNWNCKFPLQNNRWKCIDEIQVEDVITIIRNEPKLS